MKKTFHSKSYVTSNNESISNHTGKPHVSFKMLETSKFAESQTVVCSDSTLCHLWTVSSFNPVSPINFDCVVGGTVIDVHKMFLNQYRNCESTLNVIACCGLNNIPYKTARETITQMFCFQYSIHSMNKSSKVVFCSLPYPPKFCDTSVPNHLELIEKIETSNKWILYTKYC